MLCRHRQWAIELILQLQKVCDCISLVHDDLVAAAAVKHWSLCPLGRKYLQVVDTAALGRYLHNAIM